MQQDHSCLPCSYSTLLRIISLSSLPSFSKVLIPWLKRSLATLLLFISYLKIYSLALMGSISLSAAKASDNLIGTSP